jgi:hypothetical protein
MRRVKIPLKQIAGGPQFPTQPPEPNPGEEVEELLRQMENRFGIVGQIPKKYGWVAAVLFFLLAGILVWLLAQG